jgi:hypothetical protein
MLISPSTMPVQALRLDPIRPGHFGPNSMVKSGHDDRVCVTRRRREKDSNHRYRGGRARRFVCRFSFAPTFRLAGSQPEATLKVGRLTRDRWFESGFLRQRDTEKASGGQGANSLLATGQHPCRTPHVPGSRRGGRR